MRDLSRGDRGKEVLDVQTRLRGQGFELGREGVDGFFGPSTELAVRSFQQQRGLLHQLKPRLVEGAYAKLYKMVKGNNFKAKRQLVLYVEENKLLK